MAVVVSYVTATTELRGCQKLREGERTCDEHVDDVVDSSGGEKTEAKRKRDWEVCRETR